jgi:integrase
VTKRANREGSVYQRVKDSRWVAVVASPGGKRRAFYGVTQAEAVDKKNAALRSLREGLPLGPERLTVGQHVERWLTESVQPSVRPKTFHSYRQIARLHLLPGLGRIRLGRLTPQDVQNFLNAKSASGLSARTVGYCHAVLRQTLGEAERWGIVPRNVAKLVTPPRVSHQPVTPFTPEEARAFIKAVQRDRFEALFVTTLACGLRQGEVLALRWKDVDLEVGEIHVKATLQRFDGQWAFPEPKSKQSRRRIPLPATAGNALRAHRTRQREDRLKAGGAWEDWDLVFATHTGTPLSARNVVRSFKDVLNKHGMRDQRFHDLRHGCASLLAASGASLSEAKEILGHSQIAITANLYTHIYEKAKRDAMDRMDAVFAMP